VQNRYRCGGNRYGCPIEFGFTEEKLKELVNHLYIEVLPEYK
jgi:hypothetical protein